MPLVKGGIALVLVDSRGNSGNPFIGIDLVTSLLLLLVAGCGVGGCGNDTIFIVIIIVMIMII